VVSSVFVASVATAVGRSWLAGPAENTRDEGLAAFQRGEYVPALRLLGLHLQKCPDDAEALSCFAQARQCVPAPHSAHLKESMEMFRRASAIDPACFSAEKMLATSYAAVGQDVKALNVARSLVRKRPEDWESHHLLISSLMRLQLHEEAGQRLEEAFALHPDCWQLHLLHVLHMKAVDAPNSDISGYVQDGAGSRLANAHPLLRAAAFRVAGSPEEAARELLAATKRPIQEPEYMRTLVAFLEDAGLFRATLYVLDENAGILDDRHLLRIYVRRCWELGHPERIVKHLTSRRLAWETDPELLFLLASSFVATNRLNDATELLHRADLEPKTAAGRCWRDLAERAIRRDPSQATELVHACERAAEVVSQSAVLRYVEATAWMDLGEYRLATKCARMSMALAPAWQAPVELEAESRRRYERPGQLSLVGGSGNPAEGTATPDGEADAPEDSDHALPSRQQLLERDSSNVAVLRHAASSEGVRADRDLHDAVITRLEQAMPSRATQWRLARAQWLLSHDRSKSGAAKAALTLRPLLAELPDHPDGHLLLACAIAHLDDIEGAREHLTRAVESDDQRLADALRIAVSLREQGHWIDARGLVDVWVSLMRLPERHAGIDERGKPPVASTSSEQPFGRDEVVPGLLLPAAYAEARSDRELAEATYRAVLREDNTLHAVSNNLAMVLSRCPEKLDEAQRLAESAVAALPHSEEYQDTLKTVLRMQAHASAP
jgi:tetratricopeptide (TPR) repeat protein